MQKAFLDTASCTKIRTSPISSSSFFYDKEHRTPLIAMGHLGSWYESFML